VRGYGSMLLPTTPGQHVRYVHTYAPLSSSILQRFMAWMSGTHPEFFDSKFVTQGEGREVTRVKNTGVVKVTVNIMTKGMEGFGYEGGNGKGGKFVNVMSSSGNLGATGGFNIPATPALSERF